MTYTVRETPRVPVGGGFNLLGHLPASTAAAVLRPDGARAFTFEPGTAGSSGKVRAFDLTATLATNTSTFPEIGTGLIPPDSPGAGVALAISPEGTTLFLAGDQRVLVLPLP